MTGQTSFIDGGGSDDAGGTGGKPPVAQVAARPAGLLTPAEVAKELGVSDQSVYNWINREERALPVVTTTTAANGRTIRWLSLPDVIAWMRANPGAGRSGGHGGKRRRAGRKTGEAGSRGSGFGSRVKGGEDLPLVRAAMASASAPEPRDPTGGAQTRAADLTNPLDVVNLEKQRLQNELLRMKLEEQRGQKLDREEVVEAIGRGARQVRMLLEAFTAKLVPDAMSALGAPVTDRPRLEAVVAERVEEILAELARIEIGEAEGQSEAA